MENLYEKDFYQWTQENAQLLRQRRFSEVDLDNLVEEVEAMGRSEKRAFVSRLTLLILHLLKWQWQPELRSRSWKNTIREQRRQTIAILKDNPSFKHYLDVMLPEAYETAMEKFEEETDLLKKVLPADCPYSFEEIMDKEFFPAE
ncbi:MAG: DUF29 domain-containing protein [Syntrophobacteraceae bacterium]